MYENFEVKIGSKDLSYLAMSFFIFLEKLAYYIHENKFCDKQLTIRSNDELNEFFFTLFTLQEIPGLDVGADIDRYIGYQSALSHELYLKG
jgi:hypothetical protein